MAKLKGPLLSMRASGSIGKTNVYSSWRGIPYARMHVVPQNPDTGPQQLTRNAFSWLNLFFRQLGVHGLAPWDAASTGRPFTARNACIKANLANLRSAVSLVTLTGSPGARGGPALDSFTPATGAGSGDIDFDFTVGEMPAGWTLTRVVGFAVIEADPHDLDTIGYLASNYSGVNPQTFTLATLVPATEYACAGWAVYTRPDGELAFSPSMTALATSGA
jgi:hypothetical protein